MKNQAELNRIIKAATKESGKRLGWSFSRGFLFCKKDRLFFYLLGSASKSSKKLYFHLRYKWFDFDDVFWDVVSLPENKNQPLSFHAAGAFTMPGNEIYKHELVVKDFETFAFSPHVRSVLETTNTVADDLAMKIRTVNENIIHLRKLFAQHLIEYPGSVHDIYKEELITLLINNDYSGAALLINDRISQSDSGSFQFGSKSFYEVAKEYISKMRIEIN